MSVELRIGTRGSPLALVQARMVAALLRERSGVSTEIVPMTTSGDRLTDASLASEGGKGLFVKEIEEALLAGTIDLAVHSSKDMSATLPDGLHIGAVLPREDARDVVVLPAHIDTAVTSMDVLTGILGPTPRIGTSSVRRSAQLARVWPGATFAPVRGNLDTRLGKLDIGGFDALILASAGLRRLERAQRVSCALPVNVCVPAPGQGIIAVEVRQDAARVRGLVGGIGDEETAAALGAERAVVNRLGGGCQLPIGAFAEVSDRAMSMVAVVISLEGERLVSADGRGEFASPEKLGNEVAERLLAGGAGDILADVRRGQAAAGNGRSQ